MKERTKSIHDIRTNQIGLYLGIVTIEKFYDKRMIVGIFVEDSYNRHTGFFDKLFHGIHMKILHKHDNP